MGFSCGVWHSTIYNGMQHCQISLSLSTDLDLDMYTRGMVKNCSSIYLNHLLAFDSCRQVRDPSGLVISSEVHSPLLASAWAHELSSHPDKAFVEYILQGITNGFRIGFDRRQRIHSTRANLHFDKIAVVSEYLQ